MFENHPYLKQENRKAVHAKGNELRNRLFRQGREVEVLMHRASKVAKQEGPWSVEDIASVSKAIGCAETYIKTRQVLAPDIGTDRLTSSLKGAVVQLSKALESHFK